MAKRKVPHPGNTYNEQAALDNLCQKAFTELNDNWHKYTAPNKLKILITILNRKIKQQIEMSGQIDHSIKINIERDN